MIKNYLVLALVLIFSSASYAQITSGQSVTGQNDERGNIIMTSASFLTIAPDSRSAGMGDAGVATSADINSQHFNASKYVFMNQKMGMSFSYTPWLRNYVDDMSLCYLSGYNKVRKKDALGYSLTYFSLGDMVFTDENGSTLKNFTPKEFSLDASYSMPLSEYLSAGLTLRYIYSNLTGDVYLGSQSSHAGNSVAGDLSVYYHRSFDKDKFTHNFSYGVSITNIGTKLSYTDNNQNFIPTNLKAGVCYGIEFDKYNTLNFTAELNKLLVPTPPIYNSTGDSIISGKSDDVSVPVGIFQSFGDAPGGFKEEMHEISYSFGMEYWYSKVFAGRMGYFTESKDKGGRRYLTFGLGLNLNVFSFDFSYLVTTTSSNPLQNTIRLTLGLKFDNLKKEQ